MKPLDPALLRLAAPVRWLLAASVAIGIASAALMIVMAALIAGTLTDVLVMHRDVDAIAGRLVLLAVVVAARAALAAAAEFFARTSAAEVVIDLRHRTLVHVAALGPRWRSRRTGAGLNSVLGAGLDAMHDYLARYLPALVLATLVPAAMVAYLFSVDVETGLIVVLTLPLVPVFMALVGWYADRDTRRKWRLLAQLSGHFADVVAGLPVLVVFGRARKQASSVAAVAEEHRKASMATLRLAFLSSLVLELLSTLSVALVAVTVGLRLVDGHVGLSVALTVLILAPEAYLPLRTLGARFHAAADGVAAVDTVLNILRTPLPDNGNRTDLAAVPGIRLIGATVDHGAGRGVADVDLVAQPGRITAVQGPSGSGKSTALAMAAGLLQPDSGLVEVTTAAGWTDLSAIAPPAWRDAVAWCGQRPLLVPGTIAENLDLGGRLDPERRRLALEAVAAADFLTALPDGLETVVGDDGAGLSAGQRHRIALARALAGTQPVVLLDEPTADLDPETEEHVVDGMARLLAGRTVVLSTHRDAPLRLADRVVRLGPVPDLDRDRALEPSV
ncbi:ATP-binding cassette, subfamily C, CydD [Nakamurella panacisegetis]|uniref:ATP-binding cassette, subfamily C, CydD n=1 Tax=Nakamurella panacisegetis TaxID=1090615 RepID=A0A1H0QF99_9ACTN|nr:thiol reductant ABC exporter subunit CydD [Nakamurella panacisegetis]SDP15964.1 ATP-binding cassette, subfamily C, CydD [Nakamurella panacisegetis]